MVNYDGKPENPEPSSETIVYGMGILAAFLVLGAVIESSQPQTPVQKHTASAVRHYKAARDFAQAASADEKAGAGVCSSLKSATDEMIAGDVSYTAIGTTKEKFEMLSSRFGCILN